MIYDTIVIGKGPAGISAAIYLKRAGLNVLVLGKDTGTLDKAELIENYYGFPTPISGEKLAANGVRQAKRLGIEVRKAEVVGAEFGEVFGIKTGRKNYRAKTVLFAIGKKRRQSSIAGVSKFEGSGVSYCSVCDGFFYRNKTVAVIGSGEYALSEAKYLKAIASKVTIFTGGEQLSTVSDIEVNTQRIVEIAGDTRVEAVVTEEGTYPVEGVFMATGSAGAAEFALKLGLAMEGGNIVVDKDFNTNIPGIFAAGDCIGGFAQIAKVVADGAIAANTMIKHIRAAARK